MKSTPSPAGTFGAVTVSARGEWCHAESADSITHPETFYAAMLTLHELRHPGGRLV